MDDFTNYIKEIEDDIQSERKFLKLRENKLLLTDNQIEIMERNNINWRNYNTYKNLVFEIEEILEEIEDEELEELANSLQELSYYNETRK